jgi:transcriptional regulator with GAF, ATPase, and Fis domain
MDKAIELTAAERGFLLAEGAEVARNFTKEDILGEYKISRSVAQKVQSTGKPLLVSNAQLDPELVQYKSIREHHLVSILCVPIFLKNRITGVIYVDNRLACSRFKEEHVSLLSSFAEQAAIALENARLNREILNRSQELQLLNSELHQEIEKQSEQLKLVSQQLRQTYQYHNIHARSPKMRAIFKILEKIKEYDLPVLIEGESGTGKELVARAVHFSGHRKDKPFLSENCAAIAETLFESELFGYEKGAFTGAQQAKKGLFEEASGGSLFLDEIGELSLEMQKKLLRVLAEKNIRRVGGTESIPVDVKIIVATNRELKQMVKEGEFREDLFYRLNCFQITLPPLRERREDIPLLIEHFLEEAAEFMKEKPKKVERGVLSILVGYDWPGNIRQLRNEIFRLATLSGEIITAQHISSEILPKDIAHDPKINNLPQLLKEAEKKEILKALQYTSHNKLRAAQLLGISRFTLQRKMEKLGLG